MMDSERRSPRATRPAMSTFERYLSVWVALCIIAGIALGHWFSASFQALGAIEVAQVNLRSRC
jgi:arsenite transporter